MQRSAQLQMIEKLDELFCEDHKMTPEMVIMNPNIEEKKRLACKECIKNLGGFQGQTFQQVNEIIKEQKQKRNEKTDQILEEGIKQAEEIQRKLVDFISKIMDHLDSLRVLADKLVEGLKDLRDQNLKYSFFEELKIKIHQIDQSQQENDKIKKIRQLVIDRFGRLGKKLTSLPSDIDKILDNVLRSTKEFYKKKYDELNKPLELQLVQTINQRDPCYTLAFNKMSDLLFTGCGKQIKVWNFEQGNIKELTRLNGHVLSVTSIVTSSKVKNSFVSVAECGSLIIWKQKNEKEWESLKKLSQWANSIILNNEETQLILATVNGQIDVWDVDFIQNQLTFKYSLEDYHSNTIFDLSLNKKGTRMVSCGADNKILIWKKDNQDQQWAMLQEIIQVTYGTKVAFISEEIFVWMGCDQKTNDQMLFYEQQKNGTFLINQSKTQQLEIDDRQIDFHLTPIIYNQQKKAYLLRFKCHVYIFKMSDVGEIMIVAKLKYETNLIYASLSDDGKYLITYVENQKKYQILEIKWI